MLILLLLLLIISSLFLLSFKDSFSFSTTLFSEVPIIIPSINSVLFSLILSFISLFSILLLSIFLTCVFLFIFSSSLLLLSSIFFSVSFKDMFDLISLFLRLISILFILSLSKSSLDFKLYSINWGFPNFNSIEFTFSSGLDRFKEYNSISSFLILYSSFIFE